MIPALNDTASMRDTRLFFGGGVGVGGGGDLGAGQFFGRRHQGPANRKGRLLDLFLTPLGRFVLVGVSCAWIFVMGRPLE